MKFEPKIKKIILLQIRMSICNFRCHYCYLAQRPESYQGEQVNMKYSPEQVAYALRPERLGGYAYVNVCADGETLLTKDLDSYLKPLAEAGHYLEIVSNMTITPMLKKILAWEPSILSHVGFKCSFHYLELKKRGLLEVFAENVRMTRSAGASVSVEVTPSDELVPYINDVKAYSLEKFGALPHITIARDDRTDDIINLTKLYDVEYERVWSQFDSSFWKYKRTVFGKKQTGFCYAGQWGTQVDFATGEVGKCYFGLLDNINVYDTPDDKWPEEPIGRCPIAHCYNAHMLLTLGCIACSSDYTRYGDIRDRECVDGTHWLQPGLKAFFNTRLQENNQEWNDEEKREYLKKKYPFSLKSSIRNVIFRFAVLKRGYLWLAGQRQILREWRGNVYPILKAKYHNPKLAFFVLTPDHGNLGDHAIAKAAGKMLASTGISYMEISTDWLCALRHLNCLDIFDGNRIFINGGGNIGTLWPEVEQMMQDVVRNNPNSPIVILPNTAVYEHDSGSKGKILQASREVYNAHRNLTIFAREKISYELLKKHFKRVKLCPDLVLSMNESHTNEDAIVREGCLLCLRNDCERTMTVEERTELQRLVERAFPDKVTVTDMHLAHCLELNKREDALKAKFDEFRHAELVITDRLHGMIFAAITGTPCIVVNSRSHKVRGCYEWLKHLDYVKFCKDVTQIGELYRSIPSGEHQYDATYLEGYFDFLKKDLMSQSHQ